MALRRRTLVTAARSGFALAFLLLVALPVRGEVPAPWIAGDVGNPLTPGLTAVDGSGVWTILGSGDDIFNNADNFQFCYRPLVGSGSISARILSHEGGHPEWAKAGLMIRENDSPRARNFHLCSTIAYGGHATFRYTAGQGTGGWGSFLFPKAFPIYMRLQRYDQEFTGYYSEDGILWRQSTPTLELPMSNFTIAGLTATSHQDGSVTTARFDRVQVQPNVVSVSDLQACGSDRSLLLTWKSIPGTQGYHVYRVTPSGGQFQYRRLTSIPQQEASYVDRGGALENGARALYAVTPMLYRSDGGVLEGPYVAVAGTPINVPGLLGCGVGEAPYFGGTSPYAGLATFDGATRTIAIRGSGYEIFYGSDQCYFAGQTLSGDAQITAMALEMPQAADSEARAGIMIRESLAPNARNVMLYVSPGRGVGLQYRMEPGGETKRRGENVIPRNDLKLPIYLRLVRRKAAISVISAYTSTDGATYDLKGTVSFRSGLSDTLYLGLAITSADNRSLAEAKFQQLNIGAAPPP